MQDYQELKNSSFKLISDKTQAPTWNIQVVQRSSSNVPNCSVSPRTVRSDCVSLTQTVVCLGPFVRYGSRCRWTGRFTRSDDESRIKLSKHSSVRCSDHIVPLKRIEYRNTLTNHHRVAKTVLDTKLPPTSTNWKACSISSHKQIAILSRFALAETVRCQQQDDCCCMCVWLPSLSSWMCVIRKTLILLRGKHKNKALLIFGWRDTGVAAVYHTTLTRTVVHLD